MSTILNKAGNRETTRLHIQLSRHGANSITACSTNSSDVRRSNTFSGVKTEHPYQHLLKIGKQCSVDSSPKIRNEIKSFTKITILPQQCHPDVTNPKPLDKTRKYIYEVQCGNALNGLRSGNAVHGVRSGNAVHGVRSGNAVHGIRTFQEMSKDTRLCFIENKNSKRKNKRVRFICENYPPTEDEFQTSIFNKTTNLVHDDVICAFEKDNKRSKGNSYKPFINGNHKSILKNNNINSNNNTNSTIPEPTSNTNIVIPALYGVNKHLALYSVNSAPTSHPHNNKPNPTPAPSVKSSHPTNSPEDTLINFYRMKSENVTPSVSQNQQKPKQQRFVKRRCSEATLPLTYSRRATTKISLDGIDVGT